MFFIVQEHEEKIENYMKGFKKKKTYISQCLDSIAIKIFRKGVEFTKTTPHLLELLYEKTQKKSMLKERSNLPNLAHPHHQPSLVQTRIWKGNLLWIGPPTHLILNQQ